MTRRSPRRSAERATEREVGVVAAVRRGDDGRERSVLHRVRPPLGGSYAMGIEGRWAVHGTFVDAPDGTTILVTVENVDGSGLASEVSAAQPILDSIAFR